MVRRALIQTVHRVVGSARRHGRHGVESRHGIVQAPLERHRI